ncbi:amino acid ABC transporter [Rhodococcus sp. 15-725-2-2b]|nr:amino acid ABC transporter [Rhodococcus sp. 06-469-3-2]OZD49021.1 amino acid ABC transporter [Rhodococcus sp. 06-1477-1A]OZE77947.1 amino acid ABC transporter [Rhodococcus sp. 15-725-2-2b]
MKRIVSVLAAPVVGVALLTGCTQPTGAENVNSTSGTNESVTVSVAEFDQKLHDQLPENVQASGRLVSVNTGSFPPYVIIDGTNVTGATADMQTALGQVLGIQIDHQTVDGIATVLAGLQANRYDIDLGPQGDFVERQKQGTFIDWIEEHVVFAVKAGNPEGITDLDTSCGKRIAVQAAGSAEKVINGQSVKCTDSGKNAIEVQSYKDQPSSILAVQSGRADAFFSSQAPLTYFVDQAGGQLELAGVGKGNGFDSLYQGAITPKDSPLANVFAQAFEVLKENGIYDAIMTKWNLQENAVENIEINRAVK